MTVPAWASALCLPLLLQTAKVEETAFLAGAADSTILHPHLTRQKQHKYLHSLLPDLRGANTSSAVHSAVSNPGSHCRDHTFAVRS
ncbi:hypothetical protein WJX73_000667 [Symbiochloris irregularis]|uniref:Secreted protein n=1 Tax=Symbiochloris irregularis TaxID=706552 RepID=A0AAW1NW15_9CHLO